MSGLTSTHPHLNTFGASHPRMSRSSYRMRRLDILPGGAEGMRVAKDHSAGAITLPCGSGAFLVLIQGEVSRLKDLRTKD